MGQPEILYRYLNSCRRREGFSKADIQYLQEPSPKPKDSSESFDYPFWKIMPPNLTWSLAEQSCCLMKLSFVVLDKMPTMTVSWDFKLTDSLPLFHLFGNKYLYMWQNLAWDNRGCHTSSVSKIVDNGRPQWLLTSRSYQYPAK